MRQAVVIIHGIGEQKPMSTLRGFVDTLVKYEASERIKKGEITEYKKNYWSKPDQVSDSYELRRLVLAGEKRRPTTDFYEYYWAFNMQGTNIGHMIPWFKTLLLKWPWQVPNRLLLVWFFSWILTLGIVGGVLIFFSNADQNPFGEGLRGKAYSLLGTSILIGLQRTLISYIGDAARYLTPNPSNIRERQAIRHEGIALLKKLHEPDEKGEKQYDRIVVVGHSLGSVIAYDIITYLWTYYNQTYAPDKGVDAKHFDAVKQAADQLEAAVETSQTAETIAQLREVYRESQVACWKALRAAGNPWLITDLVTLGSPLAHGAFLLSDSEDDFRERKEERELLTCPPLQEQDKYYYWSFKSKRNFLHHAAAFAPTLWTNIYYPGDFIGGPLEKAMGVGIKDVEASYEGGFQSIVSKFSPVTHISYWLTRAELANMDNYKIRTTISQLFEAVDLNMVRIGPIDQEWGEEEE
ncbi:MAG: hypothetical protein KTR30_25690 [Saprospiraceae bacterium]|nr:hypothetical protein [Saprospiraceae bacterium]